MSQQSSTVDTPGDPPRTPPGPQGWSWLSLARRFLGAGDSDTTDILQWLKAEYGDVVNVYFDGDAYVLSDPEHVQYVLETNQGNYRKSAVYDEQLGELFGRGLLTAEGDLWRRQQKLVRPMFQPTTIRTFVDLIAAETRTMIDRWSERAERDESIDLLAETERVTLSIIGKAMFSEDMEQHADEMREALRVVRTEFQRQTKAFGITVPRWVPTPHNRRTDRAEEYFDSLVYDLIEKRKGRAEEFDDLLSMLMRARTEAGERMEDEQIRDEIVTFLLAGHETTATALTWTWYLLAHNPDIHRELHARALDASWSAGSATPDETMLDEQPFVKQCVQEGMRIYPPVPAFSREIIEEDRLGDYAVPAGSDVLLSQFLVHRDPTIWPDPLDYRPERFDPDEDHDRPKYSYFPFGGGARMCIGRKFALVEAQIILGMAVRELRLELESPRHPHYDDIDRSSAVTMAPGEPIRMQVHDWD